MGSESSSNICASSSSNIPKRATEGLGLAEILLEILADSDALGDWEADMLLEILAEIEAEIDADSEALGDCDADILLETLAEILTDSEALGL